MSLSPLGEPGNRFVPIPLHNKYSTLLDDLPDSAESFSPDEPNAPSENAQQNRSINQLSDALAKTKNELLSARKLLAQIEVKLIKLQVHKARQDLRTAIHTFIESETTLFKHKNLYTLFYDHVLLTKLLEPPGDITQGVQFFDALPSFSSLQGFLSLPEEIYLLLSEHGYSPSDPTEEILTQTKETLDLSLAKFDNNFREQDLFQILIEFNKNYRTAFANQQAALRVHVHLPLLRRCR